MHSECVLSEVGTEVSYTLQLNELHILGIPPGLEYLNVGLLPKSQYKSGRFYDRPTRSRFLVIVLGTGVNCELVSKFHVALNLLLRQSPQHFVEQKDERELYGNL